MMTTYYLLDPRGFLVSGPFTLADPKSPLPKGAYITDEAPPDAGSGEIVMRASGGGWALVPDPGPYAPPLPTLTHRGFLSLFLPAEIGRWRRRVKAALEADPPAEIDDVIVKADQDFFAVQAIEMGHPDTQISILIMYQEGAFGPVAADPASPTPEEQVAIDRAGQVGRAEAPPA